MRPSSDYTATLKGRLPASTGTLQAIVEHSPAAIVALDADRNVTIWNDAAERALGYAREDVLGRKCPIPFDVNSELREQEHRVLRADGTPVDLLCSVAELPASRKGERPGYVLTFTDDSERTRLRHKLVHSDHLERLGVLAGGIAHDFNNLLTAIMGNASLGMYSIEKDSELYPFFEDIIRAGERAAALTQQLLAYAGKGHFVPTTFDLSHLAQEIAAMAQASIPNRGVKVRCHLERDLPALKADRTQLQQAILNLVMNGAEAINEGSSGTVHVSTRLEIVSDAVIHNWEAADRLPAGPYALVEVRDTGSGMDEGTRARIFEPFFSTKFTGRGLGLAAVQGIVRQHGGALSVETVPGVGSTFRMLLPLVDSSHEEVRGHGELNGSGLILVVDDEHTVRNTVRRSLERWNFGVVLAENGQSAVEVFPPIASEVQAIILDLAMPVMGGEEALEHFRRIRRDVPVVLTSGYSEADAMQRMAGRGVHAFLQKPFTTEQLGRTLSGVLRAAS